MVIIILCICEGFEIRGVLARRAGKEVMDLFGEGFWQMKWELREQADEG